MSIKKRSIIFIILFAGILLYTLPGRFLDKRISLSGVTSDSDITDVSATGLLDGSYQSELNTCVENSFWGRNALIKIRSQFMYSMFGESPNKNVVIGKDNYLFEPEYIYKELNIYPTADDAYFEDLIAKLDSFRDLCSENGKEMYIFITPSKAYFCRDNIPEKYYKLGNDGENNYQRFIRYMEQSSLKYFDAHAYIEDHAGQIEAPVFYPTGIHWSHPWGQTCAKAFAEYMDSYSSWDIPALTQEVERKKKNVPTAPDADLYSSLNLIAEPKGITYYKSKLTAADSEDLPVVFIRGGSFVSQSLRWLQSAGAIRVSTDYENNFYFCNDYKELVNLSSFDSYDEFPDMGRYMSESDIIILEVNEASIPVMSWGFIDYVLENPDFLSR